MEGSSGSEISPAPNCRRVLTRPDRPLARPLLPLPVRPDSDIEELPPPPIVP